MYAFANMAWETFKYLIWPAKLYDPTDQAKTVRGEPANSPHNLTDKTSPRVFETYKADWEVFLPGATAPSDWSSYPDAARPCANRRIKPGDLILGSTNEFGNIIEPDTVPPPPGSAPVQQLMHVLVAQNGSLVYYLAAFNKSEFELIKNNKLYDYENIQHPFSDDAGKEVPPRTQAPDGSKGIEGAITIKSAWIEMTPKVHPDRFYRRWAWVQDPWREGESSRTCRYVEVGLVGLHIVHKTKSSPQWIWASFEHVDNVPGPNGGGATFNDGGGQHMLQGPPGCLDAPLPHKAPAPGFPCPVNVERLAPVAPELHEVNDAWRKMLRTANSVWANYKLVAIQWPWADRDPKATGLEAFPTPPCMADTDANLANSVMETFIQPIGMMCASTPNQLDQHTCVGCHGTTRSTDFVWALTLNNNSSTRSFTVLSENRNQALRLLGRITQYRR